jgi:hypothetical protein
MRLKRRVISYILSMYLKVTRIFDHCCSQQELFEQILEQPTNEIFTGSNWLLCTLGLTNSGRYHSYE